MNRPCKGPWMNLENFELQKENATVRKKLADTMFTEAT